MKIKPNQVQAMSLMPEHVEGMVDLNIHEDKRFHPIGKTQDCDLEWIGKEWIDQRSAGMDGDSFYGTVTWKVGNLYLVADFSL